MTVPRDFEHRYRAHLARDPRFDGLFFTAVTSTGTYCRPSCPARTPKREHVRFYETAAAAQAAGFRACKRCIPGAVPGSPEWNLRGDVAARAMALIADGVVERDGIPGLAARLGYGERQLRRLLRADLGASPLALARANRAHVARLLLETTALPITEVAFAAGFASVRQFNETIAAVFDASPTALRERRRPNRAPGEHDSPAGADDGGAAAGTGAPGGTGAPAGAAHPIRIRLARRAPFDFDALLAFLAPRAIPGVEAVAGRAYRRALALPGGPALAEVTDDGSAVECHLLLRDPRDLAPAVARLRRLLDLDADPVAVAAHLGADPLLGTLVARAPGRRAPGVVDGAELAIRAVLGQQVSVAAARTIAGRLADALGEALSAGDPVGAGEPLGQALGEALGEALGAGDPGPTEPGARGRIIRTFPSPARVAEAPDALLPMPATRRATVRRVATALAEGRLRLDAGADREEARARLLELPGVGPWTAGYIALRALGDPDVLLESDLGVRHALAALGLDTSPAAIGARGAAWAPWRSYATHHLWASLGGAPERTAGGAPAGQNGVGS